MISPLNPQIEWAKSIELEARLLPDWAVGQPLTWTIISGQGSLLHLGGIKISFTAPQWGSGAPNTTLIHVYAGEPGSLVGETTVTMRVEPPRREFPPDVPTEPDPDPPPEEEDIIPTVDCGVDPDNPDEPLKISPTEYMAGPLEEVHIGIVKIWEVCEEGCYTWRIASGGGKLLCNCGREAVYLTPRLNAECEANAVIELIYCERVIASCYVTINTWGRGGLAYVKFKTPVLEAVPGGPAPTAEPTGLGYGAGGESYWDIWGRAQRYDCQDKPLLPFIYLHVWVTRAWSIFADKWQIHVSDNKYVGGVFDSIGDIPLTILQRAYPARTVDARSPPMKKAGCCPIGLVGTAYLVKPPEIKKDANKAGKKVPN